MTAVGILYLVLKHPSKENGWLVILNFFLRYFEPEENATFNLIFLSSDA